MYDDYPSPPPITKHLGINIDKPTADDDVHDIDDPLGGVDESDTEFINAEADLDGEPGTQKRPRSKCRDFASTPILLKP